MHKYDIQTKPANALCGQDNKDKYTDKDPLNYYLRGRSHYVIHPQTDKLLHKMLQMLADNGEDYTFEYIKKKVLKYF